MNFHIVVTYNVCSANSLLLPITSLKEIYIGTYFEVKYHRHLIKCQKYNKISKIVQNKYHRHLIKCQKYNKISKIVQNITIQNRCFLWFSYHNPNLPQTNRDPCPRHANVTHFYHHMHGMTMLHKQMAVEGYTKLIYV